MLQTTSKLPLGEFAEDINLRELDAYCDVKLVSVTATMISPSRAETMAFILPLLVPAGKVKNWLITLPVSASSSCPVCVRRVHVWLILLLRNPAISVESSPFVQSRFVPSMVNAVTFTNALQDKEVTITELPGAQAVAAVLQDENG